MYKNIITWKNLKRIFKCQKVKKDEDENEKEINDLD